MSDSNHKEFHDDPGAASHPSTKDAAATSSAPIIVDEYGKPYRGASDPRQYTQTSLEILDRVKKSEGWMIVLTAIVAVASVLQLIVSCNNNASTAKQVDKIIIAADHIGAAADSFSQSASGIDHGVSDAVVNLHEQSEKMDKAREAASRTSERVLQSEERAYVSVSDVVQPPGGAIVRLGHPGSSELDTNWCAEVIFKNTGHTPVVGERSWVYVIYGAGAEEKIRKFLVPRYPYTSGNITTQPLHRTGCAKLDEAAMKSAPMFFVYGVVQYRDVFSVYHETGFCEVVPPPPGIESGCGFGNWFDDQPKNYPKGPDYQQ